MSLVDCGPSRYAIWRKLTWEGAEEICRVVEEIFLERGPVTEILMDNATVFRSALFRKLLDRWNVTPLFRAAYRAEGNGVVERHHRTIKAVAERGGIDPRESVFWYNITPRVGQKEDSIPQQALFRYVWRQPFEVPMISGGVQSDRLAVGEEVWVKPPNVKCTTQWKKGVVTEVNSPNNFSVNGMPRHVLDLRRVVREEAEEAGGGEVLAEDGGAGGIDGHDLGQVEVQDTPVEHNVTPRYPTRDRRPPGWLANYE